MDMDATDRFPVDAAERRRPGQSSSAGSNARPCSRHETNRIRRLEEEGVISGYRVALNPAKLGWSMTIMAGLRIQKGRMIDVQQKIAADPRVFAVYDVTGDWDSIVLARSNTEPIWTT